MEWPISWNDVKNNMFSVLEIEAKGSLPFNIECSEKQSALVADAAQNRVPVLVKAALMSDNKPIVFSAIVPMVIPSIGGAFGSTKVGAEDYGIYNILVDLEPDGNLYVDITADA